MDLPAEEIEELKRGFVEKLNPLRIYLFGSFAEGTYRDESDFDFYIVVSDDVGDVAGATAAAYRAVRDIKKRPIDIIVGSKSRFESRKSIPSVENEVYTKGKMIYGTGS